MTQLEILVFTWYIKWYYIILIYFVIGDRWLWWRCGIAAFPAQLGFGQLEATEVVRALSGGCSWGLWGPKKSPYGACWCMLHVILFHVFHLVRCYIREMLVDTFTKSVKRLLIAGCLGCLGCLLCPFCISVFWSFGHFDHSPIEYETVETLVQLCMSKDMMTCWMPMYANNLEIGLIVAGNWTDHEFSLSSPHFPSIL